MIYSSDDVEREGLFAVARAMCVAARTAPKGSGTDHLHMAILTGAEKDALADEMERLAVPLNFAFFERDAENVRKCEIIVLIGTENCMRGLGQGCRLCNYADCASCRGAGGVCAQEQIDLGIAVGSAVSIAADGRVDNRVMFSAGKAAISLGVLGKETHTAMGIPLSVSGKSPFFDRKPSPNRHLN